MSTLNQKTFFITGSSSGLSRATAKLFASKGWKVIATMRNPDKETELNELPGVALLPLDITYPEQIKDAVDKAPCAGGSRARALITQVEKAKKYPDISPQPSAETKVDTKIKLSII